MKNLVQNLNLNIPNRNTQCWWTRTINTRVGRKVETSLLIKSIMRHLILIVQRTG
jgi:hypothetical protein